MDVVRGKVQEVVFKHDASRIIQTVCVVTLQTSRGNILTRIGFLMLSLSNTAAKRSEA